MILARNVQLTHCIHVIFKLSTKQRVSVNRVTSITPTADHIKLVEDIAKAENQPEGLEFANINGKVTLDDFIEGINDNDDDSNASDDDFVHHVEYQKEFNEETRLEKNEGLAVDEDQADAFGNDLQQLVQDPTDRPALKNTRLRTRINGRVVALSHEIQECGSMNKMKKKKKKKKKKKNNVSSNSGVPTESEQEVDDEETQFFDAMSNHPSEPVPVPEPDPDPSTDPDPGVGVNVDDDSSSNSGVNDDKPAGLDNSFNPDGYWGINRIQAIRVFAVRFTQIFANKNHALNT
jgi:hypothetical protein